MTKKKVISLVCAFALVLTAIGGTLAYLTDKDKVENVFSVGSVDISLTETNKINDTEVQKGDDGKYSFANVIPGDTITKTPVIKNEGSETAYVRVFVTLSNTNNTFVTDLNNAIDTVYEGLGKTDAEVQAVYDNVFNGWGIQHGKDAANGWVNRMWMQKPTDSKVLAVDYIRQFGSPDQGASYGYIATSKNNTFKTADELYRNDGFVYNNWNEKSYYSDAASTESLVYVYYLKLEAGESVTLFNGLNVPADFDNNREVGDKTINQMAMFTGLNIGIYADAIQAEGFTETTEGGVATPAWVNAINALNEAHPVGYWKN